VNHFDGLGEIRRFTDQSDLRLIGKNLANGAAHEGGIIC